MSSFVNKIASTVTNKTSSIIGRENLTKLTNGLNRSLFLKSKYRDYMKNGNTIQLISKNSHMSLQICKSQNDQNRLVLFGNGQIGPEFTNSHWVIEIDPKNGHYKFRNGMNYLCFDQDVPCILTQPPIQPKKISEQIRARNEFRLHELLGSDEHFALESVYYPGRYLSILPDGSISVIRDKSQESSHFFIHVIHVYNQAGVPTPLRPQSQVVQTQNSYVVQQQQADNNNARASFTNYDSSNQKELENQQSMATGSGIGSTSNVSSTSENHDLPPPNYSNLFPSLPK
jgi:hypothetical protein